jgi:archaellum biogenesis ATPase FlaH/Zn ribbon nucleic-acid-binding protein
MAAFVRHEACPNCKSKDNLAVYSDGSYFCFSHCGYKSVSEEFKEQNPRQHSKVQSKVRSNVKKEEDMEVKPSTKPALTPEQNAEIKAETSVKAKGFRGIDDDISKYFGVRYSFAEDTGEVIEQYYPCTQDGQLSGYKIREVPKNFRSVGRTGADCELFGQFRFNRGGKYVIITEGELCALSAYQMLSEYNKSKGDGIFETAVVSPTTGANSKKQIASQYKFFDSFDNIIVCYDNDKAGKEAAEEIVKFLPKGKVRIMQMRKKDVNEYLEAGMQKEFIHDFYSAQPYVPAGVVGSSSLYEKLLESANVKKITMPPFLHKLDDMIGSIDLGTIGVLAAGTGAAKTTFTNEMVYFWLFNSPYKVGIVSLELTCGQYAQAMLSRHIENKIANIKDPQEKLKYLSQDFVKQKAEELFKTPDGNDRFMVIDERDGSVEVLQDKIEEMIISCDCKVIIADPISDVFDQLSIEQQAKFMSWQKSMIKNYNVTFINICNKTQNRFYVRICFKTS